MRIAAFDRVHASAPLSALPITLEQSTARLPVALKLALLVPLLAVMAMPLVLVGALAAEEPATRALMLDHPLAMLQMTLGLLLAMSLLAWPVRRLLGQLVSTRRVTIETGRITVCDKGLLGARTSSLPLAAFDGLAHHVRASLSGTRHELILVHPERHRSVLVGLADRIGEEGVQDMARLLGVRVIAARALYEARRESDRTYTAPAAPVIAGATA